MKKKQKRSLAVVVGSGIVLVVAGWYAVRTGVFRSYGPDNLPSAAERARMEDVVRSSETIAPNAKPGVGVVPVGTRPITPSVVPTETATATGSTTDEGAAAL